VEAAVSLRCHFQIDLKYEKKCKIFISTFLPLRFFALSFLLLFSSLFVYIFFCFKLLFKVLLRAYFVLVSVFLKFKVTVLIKVIPEQLCLPLLGDPGEDLHRSGKWSLLVVGVASKLVREAWREMLKWLKKEIRYHTM
jgi:hypothetical protein